MIKTKATIFAVFTAVVPNMFMAAHGSELNVSYVGASVTRPVHEAIARGFMNENPGITVNLFPSNHADYRDHVNSMLRETMIGGRLPDIAFEGYHAAPTYVERGIARPLDQFVPNSNVLEDLGLGSFTYQMGLVDGQFIGMPWAVSSPAVYFNTELVESVGGSPDSLPMDWDGIISLASEIDIGPATGIYFDYQLTDNFLFVALLQSLGANLLSDDESEVGFDSEIGLKALQVLRTIGEAGQVDMSRNQALAAFSAGSIGVLVTSTSYLGNVTELAEEEASVSTGPFPIPSTDGHVPAGGNIGLIFARDSETQEIAWRYLQYATSPHVQNTLARETGYMPVSAEAINDPQLLGNFYIENPNYRIAASQLPRSSRFQVFTGRHAAEASAIVQEHIRSVITLKRTPEQVLPELVQDVTAVLRDSE